MRKLAILFLVLGCLIAPGCKSSQKAKRGKGHGTSVQTPKGSRSLFRFEKSNTLSSVLDRAAQENKPVFVDFYTTWCTPCRMMDEDVFSDRSLANYYNQHFINYKVDCESGNGPNLAAIFSVNNYPTLLFLDEKGNVLVRHESAAYQSRMQELAKEALNAFKKRGM